MELKNKVLIGIVTVSAVLFLIFFALVASGRIGLLIVKSSSMSPSIPLGSLVVFNAVGIEATRLGDTIVFRESRFSNAIITHRVDDKILDNGKHYIRTKGDSNHCADIMLIGKNELVGRVIYTIPMVGHVLAFTKMPIGTLILSLSLAFFILLLVIDKIRAAERMVLS